MELNGSVRFARQDAMLYFSPYKILKIIMTDTLSDGPSYFPASIHIFSPQFALR